MPSKRRQKRGRRPRRNTTADWLPPRGEPPIEGILGEGEKLLKLEDPLEVELLGELDRRYVTALSESA